MDVWTAPGAAEAVRLLGIRRPDLIVLDLALPDADGSELVRWMRGQIELVGVPLAVYTVRDLTDADREQLQLGPSLHATKSLVEPDEFARRWAMARVAAKTPVDASPKTPVDASPQIPELIRSWSGYLADPQIRRRCRPTSARWRG